jgi:predicted N-acyltransferase
MTSDDTPAELELSVVDRITAVESGDWNRLAGMDHYSPFLEHEFLASVEESGCAAPETGWYPRHFLLKKGGTLVAAAPAYVKTHSMGEFVFDQGLAEAVSGMGMTYYPKLVATLPFTPAPGYRFLIDSGYSEQSVTDILLKGMETFTRQSGLGSYSILFTWPDWEQNLIRWAEDTGPEPVSRWSHQYFLWENDGYSSFTDFAGRFRKNQRRNILRERSSIRDSGIEIRTLTGSQLTEPVMDRMFEFYESTNSQFGPWAAYFLNRDWFHYIREHWSERIVIFAAYLSRESDATAMSMVVRKKNMMVGRYWGAERFIPNLHFELCYYAPVEYAIREGISTFDPGMGSPHKARRGFRSREYRTYHAFSDPEVSRLFNTVLPDANKAERYAINHLDNSIPWKKR